ncbi:fructose-bisphosphate aldolase class I [Candidatus Saccharibacteria bacterium]|nr:fructose-bisphosphate aldolase class I [Candidatus Saccharibacteria bacterium]
MNILIVGNVLKDVYLNLDSRTESFETDRQGVKWLDFAFNGSEHHFFSRMSSFGGAAVTAEVLRKIGLSATISATDLTISSESITKPTPADSYRYILTADDNICYLTESTYRSAKFEPPTTPVDYLFIDRSAHLDVETATKIKDYLATHMDTALIIYVRNISEPAVHELIPSANLIFLETTPEQSENTYALISSLISRDKVIFMSESAITYKNITEPITVARIDKLTHLSAYSIAAATILGGFILGKTVEESLRLARANLENSTLDNTLELKEMEIIASCTPESLELIAATLMAPKKGILAADESGGSIHKKFEALGIPDDFNHRHDYRNIFFSTPGIEDYLSGIILFDETAHDYMNSGESIPDYLIAHRIIPGIKVDEGLTEKDGEYYTRGITNLPTRLREYYEMGLRFAKWRAAFKITLNDSGRLLTPSSESITENCRLLAEYAALCQSAGLVPIVEPEVIYDGNHSITKCAEATGKILDTLTSALTDFGVNLRATIIKTNMITSGKSYHTSSTPDEIARATAEVLLRHIPASIGGVVFLSGGQTPEQATANLAAILRQSKYPFPVTFSFARAIQDPVLNIWHGINSNAPAAKEVFLDTLKRNCLIL